MSALKRWEDGKNTPSVGDLLLFAQVTGVRFEWLKTGEGAMRASSSAESFATLIRDKRQKLRLPQETVARKAEEVLRRQTGDEGYTLSLSMYQEYEAGANEPTWSRARAILEVLGLNEPSGETRVEAASDLKESGRNVCLRLTGPDGRILASVDLVLMGTRQPLQVPLTLGVEGVDIEGD